MTVKNLSGDQRLLRIYIGEADKVDGRPLHFEILEMAKKMGLAGCSALRGIMGFGASSVVHTDHLLRMSSDLPIVIEVVDTAERIGPFLTSVAPLLKGALVTEEKVNVRFID